MCFWVDYIGYSISFYFQKQLAILFIKLVAHQARLDRCNG